MKNETVTIKRTVKGVWMKRFDSYDKSFTRIGEKEALESVKNARENKTMFSDDNENSDLPLVFGYYN